MSASLFFNISFDLSGISLILFVVWFFVNFNNAAAAFKWFSLSILSLLASVIILSYGTTKLSNIKSTLPHQNQTEIMNLRHKISTLKDSKKPHTTNKKVSTHKTSHSSTTKPTDFPSRVVNAQDNQLVKAAVSKHSHRINLVAKVTSPGKPLMVRGVHSPQIYQIKDNHKSFNANEFIVIKGTATSVNGNVINVTASSAHKQA